MRLSKVLADARFDDVDAQLEQFAMNTRWSGFIARIGDTPAMGRTGSWLDQELGGDAK